MTTPVAVYDVDPLTAWLADLDPPLYPVRDVVIARREFINDYPYDDFRAECEAHTDLAKYYLTEVTLLPDGPGLPALTDVVPLVDPPGPLDLLRAAAVKVAVATDPVTVYPGDKWDAVQFPAGQPQTFPVETTP